MLACFDTAEYFLSKMEKDAGNATSSPTSWQHGPLCPASSTPESSTTRLPL